MGGGQANPGQASAAFSGAQGTTANAGALSKQAQGTSSNYNSQQQQLFNTLFGGPSGSGGGSGGGALTNFLNPSNLNVTTPQGPYALQYTNTAQNIDKGTQQALATANRNAAQRGFGAGSPAGFTQSQDLQAMLAGNAAKGNAYQQATTSSYQDALNNFWKAAGMTGQQAATSGSQGNTALGTAASANQGASQTYGQLYGTSGAYHPSQAATSATALGGDAIKGIAACICEGTPILMADGRYEAVENLKPGDKVKSPDEHSDVIDGIEITTEVPCWLVSTDRGSYLRASSSHTLARSSPGYVTVDHSLGVSVLGKDKSETVTEVASIGKRTVYKLKLRHCHVYLSGGLWSLE